MGRQGWRTPRWLFAHLERYFDLRFVLDAAADESNFLCDYLANGLTEPWHNSTFCNPPFGDAGAWAEKADAEGDQGITALVILPVGCSQRWLHKHAKKWTIYLPDTRLHFLLPDGTPASNADRDSMILAVGPDFRNHNAPDDFRVRPLPIRYARPGKNSS
jgi:phage N-6-adenine-methyltransferase